MDTSDDANTSTESLCFSNSPKTLDKNPYAPNIWVEWISMSRTLFLNVIAVTKSLFSFSFRIIVPVAVGLYEFFTRTGTLAFIAGDIAIGCNTCAPKYANSAASS